ncbi:hypothetical protein O3M35_006545 [Rhynocoris fuscipes]|uniref:Uncharacterized protein n=1 Tax=Rhynocoris fuscipes TaxID=488301 RepID=A0AAW1DE44_9HEMI
MKRNLNIDNDGHSSNSKKLQTNSLLQPVVTGRSEIWGERKAVSPPLAMSSLPSDCGRLHTYDSFDSVYKSTSGNTHSNSRGVISDECPSVSELTPSPCDSSTLADLEGALRERDSELQYLRQTMEHNERVIFRVYEEKERAWERETRRLKALHETRLRSSAQRAHRLEQMLMMHTYQLQQDKKRLREEVERAEEENATLRREVELLRNRLEETEWSLCQKSGELALVKSKLKETQNDHSTKVQEIVTMKSEIRELNSKLRNRDEDIEKISSQLEDTRLQLDKLRLVTDETETNFDKQKNSEPVINNNDDEIEDMLSKRELSGDHKMNIEAERLRNELARERAAWQMERAKWADEKGRVLIYQKRLQLNYVNMYNRNRELEEEIEALRGNRSSTSTAAPIPLERVNKENNNRAIISNGIQL